MRGKKLTLEEFIIKSNLIHKNKYTYLIDTLIKVSEIIPIICPYHGIFNQRAKNHIYNKQGCPKCVPNYIDTDIFIERSNITHNNIYDYSKVKYKNQKHKVIIICKEHGEFSQSPDKHLLSQGCPGCFKKTRKSVNQFIKESNSIHNNEYDYSKSNYINRQTKVVIICKEHGEFLQSPSKHLYGQGCPLCSMSRGEKYIINYLDNNDISYIKEYKFDNCLSDNDIPLRFDFYLPDFKLLIEYDGQQHFKPLEYFGGDCGFKRIKRNDNIKDNYCLDNKLKLLRIPYEKINSINLILDKTLQCN